MALFQGCTLFSSPIIEVPRIDVTHTFEGAFACSEIYRHGSLVAVANCLNYKWSIHVSTKENNYKRITYSDYYGPGGGGIDKLYKGDFDHDGDEDLMAYLINGGTFRDGKPKSEVIFFMLDEDDLKMKRFWTEQFDPMHWEELYQQAQPTETGQVDRSTDSPQ